jgi:hypothetical protein
MKTYIIDELRPWEYGKIKAHLEEKFKDPHVDGIYWIPLDSELLNESQKDHEGCQPHCFALELAPDRLSCELLVRTRERIRCDCISYATEAQRNWLIRLVDGMLDDLGIIT